MLPTVLDVYEARKRLAPHLKPTPLLSSSWLSSIADGNVFLKLESLNQTHSFKIRGALNAALKLMEAYPAEGGHPSTPLLVTASAGNHGRALALAAERLGLSCVVFTPETAPETKQAAIRRHGAVLHADCEDYDTAETRARDVRRGRRRHLHFALQPSRRHRRRRHHRPRHRRGAARASTSW